MNQLYGFRIVPEDIECDGPIKNRAMEGKNRI